MAILCGTDMISPSKIFIQRTSPAFNEALRGPLARAMDARERLKRYVVGLQQQGLTSLAISDRCGIGEHTLHLWRREQGLVRKYAPPGQNRLDPYADEIAEAWREGELLRTLAERYQTTAAKISVYVKRLGLPPRAPGTKKGSTISHIDPAALAEMRVLYESGLSSAEIGRRHGVSDAAVRWQAKRKGWVAPPDGRAEQEELIFALVQQGFSLRGICRNTNLCRSTISEILQRHGWEIHPNASDEQAGAPPRHAEGVRHRGALRGQRLGGARPRQQPWSAAPQQHARAARGGRVPVLHGRHAAANHRAHPRPHALLHHQAGGRPRLAAPRQSQERGGALGA